MTTRDDGDDVELDHAWRPNATEFTIHRMPSGDGRDFEVTWENSWGEEDEDGNATPEEGALAFETIGEAFTFCEGLLAAFDAISDETDREFEEAKRKGLAFRVDGNEVTPIDPRERA